MSFGIDFINAVNAGQQTGQQRKRQNALMGAGQMAAQGDARGGMNALLSGGYIDEANSFNALGERQRADQTRQAATAAYQGTTGSESDRLKAVSGAYANAGDFEGMAQIREMAQGMDAEQRKQTAQAFEFFGTTAATLAGQNLPPEQAQAQAIAAIQRSPFATPEMIQQLQQMPPEQFTPQALNGHAQQYGMSAAEILGERRETQQRTEDIQYRGERDQVEDRRWQQSFGLQQRQVANQESAARDRAAPPLRGADKQLMDSVRDTATSSRGLRGLAQEFRSTIAGQPVGPVDGSTYNPGTYFNPQQSAARALASRMTGLMRPTGSGATSDFEQRLYQRGAPSLDKPAEANDLIIDGMETLGRISDARQFFYEDFAEANGSLNGAERAFQQSEEFRQLTQGGGGGQAAPQQGGQRRRFNPQTGRIE